VIELNEIKKIIEALIFASDSPISENRIKNVIAELDPDQIHEIVTELNHEYDQNEHAFKIVRLAGGYQFATRAEYASYIKQYYKGRSKSRLSRAALETLAIIAFKQPISRPEIDSIRGVNSDGVVKNLLERNLIHISGRSETIGRALLYSTTSEFLQYFGVNDIADLPKPREIEELLGSGQEELPFSSDELDGKIVEKISTLDEGDLVDDEVE
jgi:segregation and condensation protein B